MKKHFNKKTPQKLQFLMFWSTIIFFSSISLLNYFQKLPIDMSSGCLLCNQCIKTLYLSYQTALQNNFFLHLKVILLDLRVFPIQINVRLYKIPNLFFLCTTILLFYNSSNATQTTLACKIIQGHKIWWQDTSISFGHWTALCCLFAPLDAVFFRPVIGPEITWLVPRPLICPPSLPPFLPPSLGNFETW